MVQPAAASGIKGLYAEGTRLIIIKHMLAKHFCTLKPQEKKAR